jgi:hypothetical protein
MSSARDHVTPHILKRKTRQWLRNFVINDAKRLLQHYLPIAGIALIRVGSCTGSSAGSTIVLTGDKHVDSFNSAERDEAHAVMIDLTIVR